MSAHSFKRGCRVRYVDGRCGTIVYLNEDFDLIGVLWDGTEIPLPARAEDLRKLKEEKSS
jgi:hypothetical protein